MSKRKQTGCKHPPERLYSWFARDDFAPKGRVLCVVCVSGMPCYSRWRCVGYEKGYKIMRYYRVRFPTLTHGYVYWQGWAEDGGDAYLAGWRALYPLYVADIYWPPKPHITRLRSKEKAA